MVKFLVSLPSSSLKLADAVLKIKKLNTTPKILF